VTPPSIIGYKKIIKAWWATYLLDYVLELDWMDKHDYLFITNTTKSSI
jgi:hypothetical protein